MVHIAAKEPHLELDELDESEYKFKVLETRLQMNANVVLRLLDVYIGWLTVG